MQKIGVFVCWCGSNIAGTVDVHAVAEAMKNVPGVVYATDYQYMCSEVGQQKIREAIAEYGLTGVVVCSCSPRMHEATFRKTAEKAGLNPYMVEIANIREQCSWIHKDKEVGTEKAITLAKAAVAKVLKNAPLTAGTSPVIKRALVIGGGIAGIQTALDIADAGFEVDIVEKSPTIGGRMAQLDKTFPTLDCAACILTPKMVDAAQSEKIDIISYAEVEKVSGFVGNFTVTIRKKARYVDTTKCTGCGACMEKCPSRKGRNEFNMGLNTRTAIYIPFAQAALAGLELDALLGIDAGDVGNGLCERDIDGRARVQAHVELVPALAGGAFLHARAAAGALGGVHIARLFADGDGEVAHEAGDLFDLGVGDDVDLLALGGVHHLRGEDAGRAVQGREGLVQLRHAAADGGRFFDDVHFKARVGDVERGLDAGDAAADDQRALDDGAGAGGERRVFEHLGHRRLGECDGLLGADFLILVDPGALLAAHARGHLPQDRGKGRAQPLHGGDRQHPRAVLLDPQG